MDGFMTPDNQNGFTILEIVFVIVIVGILSFAVFSSFSSTLDTANLSSYVSDLKARIHYTQTRAMTRGGVCSLSINGNTYSFINEEGVAESFPGVSENVVGSPDGLSGLSITSAVTTIAFDSWGRPSRDRVTSSDGKLLENNLTGSGDHITITVSCSGESKTLDIYNETGFMEID